MSDEKVAVSKQQITDLKQRNKDLKSKVRRLKSEKNDLIDKNKKLRRSKGKFEGYEEISRRKLKKSMAKQVQGIGKQKAKEVVNKLKEEVKLIAPKDE